MFTCSELATSMRQDLQAYFHLNEDHLRIHPPLVKTTLETTICECKQRFETCVQESTAEEKKIQSKLDFLTNLYVYSTTPEATYQPFLGDNAAFLDLIEFAHQRHHGIEVDEPDFLTFVSILQTEMEEQKRKIRDCFHAIRARLQVLKGRMKLNYESFCDDKNNGYLFALFVLAWTGDVDV
jgi:hypothetical protein